MFSNDVEHLIEIRKSHRSFSMENVEDSILNELCTIPSGVAAPFGSKIYIQSLRVEGDVSKELKELGAYGMIRGARAFITGSACITTEGLIDFGYVFENALLRATDLGLGTCWVGGTMKRSSFSSRIKLQEGTSLVCVSPVGYSLEKTPVRDKVIRFVVGAAKRKPWTELFFNDNFGTALDRESASKYAQPLEMLRLAPSASNKQPWRVVMEKKTGNLHFFINRSPLYQKIMEKGGIPDLQLVDMGICMSHFYLSSIKHNMPGKWSKVDVSSIVLPKDTEYVLSWIV